ncbi:MAG: DUF2520 domain-containing protein [Acidobacteria bacterium]|nr:DUF2520 domain-containing protein [Acidobacteriota bacterium]
MSGSPHVQIIGPGRAGLSLQQALTSVGWTASDPWARDEIGRPSPSTDIVVIATPDAEVASVAGQVPKGDYAVLHMSGALTLKPLGGHARRGSIHPLVALPSPQIGSVRLLAGGWFAVAGDDSAQHIAEALGGSALHVSDDKRVAYHAAAVIAANHLVALLGQVERIADHAGVAFEPFIDLARASLDDVAAIGPEAALTGPAARGDQTTIDAHLAALDPSEHDAYRALAALAGRLVT